MRRFRKARSARDRSQLPANWRLHKNPRTCFEGPFGEVIRATGPMARANPFRFSTKYQDDEPDLVYYGYRYYSASTGRWLSKDVVRSWVEINLCAFVKNNPVNNADYLGLQITPGITNVPHVPRPYPPRTPFPQKLLKKYDCSCCNAEEIKKSKKDLVDRFTQAKGNLDSRHLKPNGDANAPGEASCDTSNGAILNFMNPTPRCWVCFMDRRVGWDWGSGLWDENFIHCYTVNNSGIQDELILDWFDSAYHQTSGVYENAKEYEKKYQWEQDQYKNTPVWADCSKPSDTWKPDFTKFDFIFDQDRRDPPVNR